MKYFVVLFQSESTFANSNYSCTFLDKAPTLLLKIFEELHHFNSVVAGLDLIIG